MRSKYAHIWREEAMFILIIFWFNEEKTSAAFPILFYFIFIIILLWSFKKYFIFVYLFIFRDWGKEGEREREKHQCVVASYVAPTGDLACNPGMCPDWESNRRPFDSQPALSPLSYTSQGFTMALNYKSAWTKD